MTENQLKALLRKTLLDGLLAQGINDVPVINGYQPTGQGREPKGLYFFPLAEPGYGWQYRKDRYDPASGEQIHSETQLVRSTFQIAGFAEANLQDASVLTAQDITGLAAMLLVSASAITALRRGGAGVERVTAIRTLFIENDQGRNEATPSFDITLTHKRTLTQRAPSIEAFEHAFTRV
ncbi:hypothetical protein NRB16_24480 [Pseudomonas sp. LJDD11]|uniref:phage gateway protein n=1 Tax=Pseudomonas sp. LJDD11 TaxID=2931984 RepID=UPI00211C34AF|nr:hypothetical protein [Pseudomonas sp. LJDD11]MCQ9426681.1 hypothetical protein [Pseudomonas sp. LJDD11]